MSSDKDEELPVFGNAQSKLVTISDLVWTEKTIFIDGYYFEECSFYSCRLITFGGVFDLNACNFIDSTRIYHAARDL